jgi:hypothetical protein
LDGVRDCARALYPPAHTGASMSWRAVL